MGRTGIIYHPDCLAHDMGSGHPEGPRRVTAIMSRLEETSVLSRLAAIPAEPVPDRWITEIHTPAYLQSLEQRAPQSGRVQLDPDTAMSAGSLRAAYLAAGAGIKGVDAIMAGAVEHVFCAVRPPGHHAESARAMGFCFFNNVAIATRYAQKAYGVSRVLIVDWDVHHGNGTQHSFYDDGSVLYFSTHQYPYYPGTGHAGEVGEGAGRGLTVNVPMASGDGDTEYLGVFEQVLVPAADKFRPDLVVISAGFDAHKDDPLAGMALTESGYAALTRIVAGIARKHSHGRILSCLEGGYDLSALAASVEQHLLTLLAA